MEATLSELLQQRPAPIRGVTHLPGIEEVENIRRCELLRQFHAQIGLRYARCEFANFEQRTDAHVKAVATLQSACRRLTKTSGGILFVGPPGAGKDHLAAAAAGYAIRKHGLSVSWINGVEWYARQRDRINGPGTEAAEVAKLVAPDVLLISDPIPPDTALTSYQAQMLYQVVDRRYRNLKATWATVNAKNKSDLASRLTGPIADRLNHDAAVIQCWWESYRTAARDDA